MAAIGHDDLIGIPSTKAQQLIGVDTRRLRSWEDRGLIVPQLRRQLSQRHTVRSYSLDQVVEMAVIRALEAKGIDIRHIRFVIDAIRERYGVRRPLRELKWGVEGKQTFVQFADGEWVGDRQPAQGVLIDTIPLEEIRADIRQRATTRRSEDHGRIVRRQRVRGGKPVIAGTRIPVETVQKYLDRGRSVSDILRAYPQLTGADVEAVRSISAAG